MLKHNLCNPSQWNDFLHYSDYLHYQTTHIIICTHAEQATSSVDLHKWAAWVHATFTFYFTSCADFKFKYLTLCRVQGFSSVSFCIVTLDISIIYPEIGGVVLSTYWKTQNSSHLSSQSEPSVIWMAIATKWCCKMSCHSTIITILCTYKVKFSQFEIGDLRSVGTCKALW